MTKAQIDAVLGAEAAVEWRHKSLKTWVTESGSYWIVFDETGLAWEITFTPSRESSWDRLRKWLGLK